MIGVISYGSKRMSEVVRRCEVVSSEVVRILKNGKHYVQRQIMELDDFFKTYYRTAKNWLTFYYCEFSYLNWVIKFKCSVRNCTTVEMRYSH